MLSVLSLNILQFHYFNLVVLLAIFHGRGCICNFNLTVFSAMLEDLKFVCKYALKKGVFLVLHTWV